MDNAAWLRQILFLCILFSESSMTYSTMDDYKTLYKDILEGYDVRVKPRFNQTMPLDVYSSLSLLYINKFDTSEKRLDFIGTFTFMWSDDGLVWDPADYGGIARIEIPINQVWYPGVSMSSVGVGRRNIGDIRDIVGVTFDGNVTWMPDGTHSFGCEMSLKYYPFDQQKCNFLYYIAATRSTTIQLRTTGKVDRSLFYENSEWELVDVISEREDVLFVVPIIYVNFTLNRRPQFTTHTLIIPLMSLSGLNAFTFLLPIDSGEKVSLSITIFLAYGFFISFTQDNLPNISTEVSYYLIYMTVLSLYSALTVIYVIIEQKISSEYGNKLIEKTKPRNIVEPSNIVEPIDNQESDMYSKDTNDGADEASADHNPGQTWNDYIKRVDSIVCVISVLFILLFNTILLNVVITRGL